MSVLSWGRRGRAMAAAPPLVPLPITEAPPPQAPPSTETPPFLHPRIRVALTKVIYILGFPLCFSFIYHYLAFKSLKCPGTRSFAYLFPRPRMYDTEKYTESTETGRRRTKWSDGHLWTVFGILSTPVTPLVTNILARS